MLQIHQGGTIGNSDGDDRILTVVSTNDPTGQNVTQITATEPTGSSDPNAIKFGDMAEFVSASPGKPRFLTFNGHIPQQTLPAQFLITSDATTVGGAVTIDIRTTAETGLASSSLANGAINIDRPIVVGMKIRITPSHEAGCLFQGDSFYLAVPKLPDEDPFFTKTVDENNISIRHYSGTLLGQNTHTYVRDVTWGSQMLAEASMRILLPVLD